MEYAAAAATAVREVRLRRQLSPPLLCLSRFFSCSLPSLLSPSSSLWVCVSLLPEPRRLFPVRSNLGVCDYTYIIRNSVQLVHFLRLHTFTHTHTHSLSLSHTHYTHAHARAGIYTPPYIIPGRILDLVVCVDSFLEITFPPPLHRQTPSLLRAEPVPRARLLPPSCVPLGK
ncbi:hypothetical protein GGS23DRAFT_296971 [Durotheca rogersii]|uniref:uncharacterized protein n=1 Tax=Durotheca rogersii TaxID=419775 RepID=UPI00221FB6E9|nr:uncharacterized protein GGS23DRAFT_296971 [Durotheca rogersii]KAI5866930.1 hypothetical protein GGS23DRAFT_296971 [Durotheca rogersii]